MASQIPVVDYLSLDGEAPVLVAHRCTSCAALYFDRRNACAHCGSDEFEPAALARTGRLRSYTIVHRSAPGVSTPFISAVVALDGGGEVKATLRGIEPDPALLHHLMPVELVTFVAATAADGTEAIGFGFRPSGSVGDQPGGTSAHPKEHTHA